MIQTAFTRLMGVDHPVVSAGMGAGNTDGELVGRVSEAGGLGVIGASFLDAHEVVEMIKRLARSRLIRLASTSCSSAMSTCWRA